MKSKEKCLFGKTFSKIVKKKGKSLYRLAKKYDVWVQTLYGIKDCLRFPSAYPFDRQRVYITDLAKMLDATEEEKYELYSALVDTFYPGLSKHFPEIEEEKLTTKEYIRQLLKRKKKEYTWSDIAREAGNSVLRVKMGYPSSVLTPRDVLAKLFPYLDITDKEKAEIIYWYLLQHRAFPEFLEILRKGKKE